MSDSSSADRPGNRLMHETSPYLLQHARNPVEWYPWGDEALNRAKREEKPIFLSIGYSACHWCHVMEHESFEDPEIAALMNEHFINIKVDREERPDLDQIYMSAVQILTHRGGWPMSVFLTPDRRPFYGGTYWPPRARMGMPGFTDILLGVQKAWMEQRGEVQHAAEQLTQAVIDSGMQTVGQESADIPLLRQSAEKLCRNADRVHGGFGAAPKFLHSMDLRFLLRSHRRFGMAEALNVVTLTLDKMAAGGIYDQLGGGFHRYSTDARWLAPHFEKMLYDNALLVPVYLEAWQVTKNEDYLRVVRETLEYVAREMTSPEGAFYSTQDADSEGVEGKFFTWSLTEIEVILGAEEARLLARCYDVTAEGNWEETNILNRPKSLEDQARILGLPLEDLLLRLQVSREKLLAARVQRIAPGRDEKILTAWNGMMIAALSRAARVMDEPRYAEMSRRAADFILQKMSRDEGGLWHVHNKGESRVNGFLDDYACLLDGLIELHQTTLDTRFLEEGARLAETMLGRFHDERGGGLFYTSGDHEELIARQKDLQDNATPAGNSMAAWGLLRLGRLCGRNDWEEAAEKILPAMTPVARQYPSAAGQALLALDFVLGPAFEVVVAESGIAEQDREVWKYLQRDEFLPHVLWLRRVSTESDQDLSGVTAAVLRGKTARNQVATLYVCEKGTCGMPLTDLAGLRRRLQVPGSE